MRRGVRDSHLNNFSWVPKSHHPKQDIDPFSRFAGRSRVTDRHTDTLRYRLQQSASDAFDVDKTDDSTFLLSLIHNDITNANTKTLLPCVIRQKEALIISIPLIASVDIERWGYRNYTNYSRPRRLAASEQCLIRALCVIEVGSWPPTGTSPIDRRCVVAYCAKTTVQLLQPVPVLIGMDDMACLSSSACSPQSK